MKKRMNNLDLLRIISCYSIILLHVSSIWINSYMGNGFFKLHKIDFYPVYLESICRFAVPIFFMLTGALQLGYKSINNYKEFYKKSVIKILIPTIFFSVLFLIYNLLLKFILIQVSNGNYMQLFDVFKEFLKGYPYYHLWYLIVICFIYLLIPILYKFKKSIKYELYKKICIVYFFLAIISSITSEHTLSYDIGLICYYIGYVLIGDIIITDSKTDNRKSIILIMLSIIIISINAIIRFLVINNNILLKFSLVENFSPLIVISSILLFLGFTKIRIRKDLSSFSNITLYIYIFHAVILDTIVRILVYFNILNSKSSNLFILLLFIVVSLLSIVISKIWINVKKNIYNNLKIEHFIDRIFI